MPRFFYTTRDSAGKKITGYEEVASSDELINRLQSRNLVVIDILSDTAGTKSGLVREAPARKIRLRRYRITQEDLVLFCRQLATLLGAGVTILKSLDIIAKQVASTKFYNIIKEVENSMERGLSLHEAMSKHPKAFSDLWVNLVGSGEASGNLFVVLERLATYLERDAAFKRKVISSLIYPIILMVAGLGALLFLTIKIIPTFSELFKGFNMTLPLLTRILILVSDSIRRYIFYMFGLTIVGIFVLKKYIGTKEGRRNFERMQLSLPLFGDFLRALIIERFSSGMATLIESGVPLLYSLEITEHSVDNVNMADIIHHIKEEVRVGSPLNHSMDKSNFFEPLVVQMVAVGEEIGELPQMFKRINTFYQEYVETILSRFASMFEPVILIFMGAVVGLMVIGIFLPIFQLSQIH